MAKIDVMFNTIEHIKEDTTEIKEHLIRLNDGQAKNKNDIVALKSAHKTTRWFVGLGVSITILIITIITRINGGV